ncbi:MAG TPA: M2 family metallopeptidase [Bacteroidota bacterium]|nr:M2 family metallopeptidase [Bacteroidota bacterium]
MRTVTIILFTLLLGGLSMAQPKKSSAAANEAKDFLTMYNTLYQKLYTISAQSQWQSSTDVSDEHTGQRIGADKALAVFQGSTYVIEKCRNLLKHKKEIDAMSVRQLENILLNAAQYPGTIPDVVAERVTAEANQSAVLDGFRFCDQKMGDSCLKFTTPNRIDAVLSDSLDLTVRRHAWEVSKQTGAALKPGLTKLQDLRNRMAQEMGYTSFFALQVADYGMTVPEMMKLLESSINETKPMYEQLHYWAKTKLAAKFHQPVPDRIPAHWLGNRWSQAWPGIVEGVDLDNLFKDKTPEWIVKQAESFYVSLGMPSLPKSFWDKSDLYELPPGSARKKNTHASAWHIDLDKDIRSLMSVRANYDWFQTAHHELGHIYYYIAYSNPNVPITLRAGANRAFHEAIGDLIAIAARQIPYLKEIGLMPNDMKIDQTQWLLSEALDNAVVFIPWSAGTMSHWEHDFYEDKLSPTEYNKRWWNYVAKYQGVDPPEQRGEEYCDAATKTHINDDPAQYYDYTLAFLIKYQLHNYIAKNILHQDPHNCNYYGNKEVGKWLTDLLKLGATRDWRKVIKEKTGEDISPKGMLEYFAPVMEYLKRENAGNNVSWGK